MAKSKITQCPKCGKSVTRFAEHTRRHTGKKPYQCNVCNKKFVDNSNCQRHVQAHSYEELISYQSLVELELLFGNSKTLNSFKEEFENYDK